jgi:hypothetical protein
MFAITGKEISELNDSDLRSLVGLLCEAELRANNLPTACVTWGGHQNAKDGGLDVRVELAAALHPDGFIPRVVTGFQVKKPDMPRSKIIEEMRPDGELRPVISELAETNGAYIIVCSTGSTADSALRDRRNAMLEAVSGIDNASNLRIDFYDRDRLAGWVRCHPSLVLWVRGKIGKALPGWRPFGNWANTPGGLEEEYLLDEEVRVHDGFNLRSDGMTAIDGINRLRSILHRPASSVRLTGLSGVGKTRLLQALFDGRIGENPLNPSQVFYSDVSDSPHPDPRNFAERLISLQMPAILAVDNCPPDLHRRLTSVCTASGSLVSLITVEYDVREDQPEETEVFRLEPASIALIEKMIQKQFGHLSQIDAQKIAEFSGGNARIAIALANTIKKGETLADFKDEDLFQRLFHQRKEANNTLLRSAEVCSLVYSFDCQTTKDSDIELRLLGYLANRTVNEIFSDVAELTRRDLVQQRNIWGAVLPHALANKLAQRALENIPLSDILEVFVNRGSERLLKSFSRRLSYLHQCPIATEIAKRWLSEKGLLSDVSNLNDLGITLLENIAPISPKATLDAIERAANKDNGHDFTSRNNKYFINFTRLLRSLAYDPEIFERCTELICRFALSEDPKENQNSIRDLLKSLFFIYFSGTHASAHQRLDIIEKLVNSKSVDEQALGLLLLNSALTVSHFSPYYNYDFGAHSRDYGYSPKTPEEIHQWFSMFVNLTNNLALSEQPIAPEAKKLLAEKFSGLWIRAGVFNELEKAAKSIIKEGAWNAGWTAVRTTIRFHGKQMDLNLLSRLRKLEELLKPNSLLELARVYAFSDHRRSLDLVDAEDERDEKASDRYKRVEKVAMQIGRKVASNESVFRALLPEIVSVDGARLYSFARGLAEGCKDPLAIWKNMRDHLSTVDVNQQNYTALCGFLYSLSEINPELSEHILNDALTDDVLSARFPLLQTSVRINERGIERLKQSLGKGLAQIWTYQYLAYGRAHESISDDDLCEILRAIASKPDGLEIAIDILTMRLPMETSEKLGHSDTIKAIGKDLLAQVVFDRDHNRRSHIDDYELENIANVSLVGSDAADTAKILCENLAKAFSEYKLYSMDYPRLLCSLALNQPQVFLESLLGNNEISNYQLIRIFTDDLDHGVNPLSQIADNIIIDWCEKNPAARYPVVAASIVAYRKGENENQFEWVPLSLTIIDNAPDAIAVLNEFKRKFRPMSWSGSRADIMQRRLSLISSLKSHRDPVVSEWACNEERMFEAEIRSEREGDDKCNRSQNERFE